MRLFLAQQVAAGVRGTRLQGKAIGRADGGEIVLEGDISRLLLVPATTFTGECETGYDDQQRADNHLPCHFSHSYGGQFLHSSTKIIK